ncbi:extracellular matrix regulator RemB [Desulfosporosinus sp. BICA1-9]|uniref:extracellular matrix regulator RemB n=1 Tax=Desulfosporosinus sp. BICA1-9 TaxID=1531958 RepID=UPI00054B2064|nr:extracellular matrix/biofilm biosynthesis regulator RemA family protein [Desulfosporosinus sp. BICA1-9]KJS89645.1 MAG: hypothetical protein JL57_06125 [Desulfosporosinus sp. BICA1-9]HBW37252.1 DUF370 domain-containing protein [Desulfosporosinus sp.]
MYLHLGGNILIKKDKIVAMIDLDTTKKGQTNQDFISKLNKDKNLNYICEPGNEKTLIVTRNELFFSPISSTTLFKRSFDDKVNDYN